MRRARTEGAAIGEKFEPLFAIASFCEPRISSVCPGVKTPQVVHLPIYDLLSHDNSSRVPNE